MWEGQGEGREGGGMGGGGTGRRVAGIRNIKKLFVFFFVPNLFVYVAVPCRNWQTARLQAAKLIIIK